MKHSRGGAAGLAVVLFSVVSLVGGGAFPAWVAAQESLLGPAQAALQSEDYQQAITLGLQELQRDPKSHAANHLVGLAYQKTGKLAEARPHLERAQQQDSKNADYIYDLGTLYLQLKMYPEAQKMFAKALKFRKENKGRFHYGIGLAFLEQGQLDQALISLLKAREEDAQNPKIFAAIGEAYSRQNVPPLAIDSYREAVRLAPDDLEVRYALGKLLQKQSQYNEALEEFREIVRRDSTRADPYFDMGNLFLAAKRYPEAVTELTTYTKIQPGSFAGQMLLAKAYYAERLPREAQAPAEKAAALDSTSVEVQRLLLNIYFDVRDFENTVRTAERLEPMVPGGAGLDAEEYLKWGRSLTQLQRYPEAIVALQKTLDRDPNLIEADSEIGTLLVIEKRYEEAIPHLERSAQADPSGAKAFFNQSIAYMGLKDWPRAIGTLKEGLKLKPDNLDGWVWLANCYSQADSLGEAAGAYEQVARLDPKNSEAFKQVGYYSLVRRSYPKAIQNLRRHLELEPGSEMGWLWLAQATALSRQYEESKAAYRRVLKINPNNADAKKGLTLVEHAEP